MEIHVLQTGTVRVKQFQLTGANSTISRFYQLMFTQKWSEWMPIYCWLIKMDDQLILVDTGDTAKIYQEGYLPSGGLYHKAVETRIKKEEEVSYQLEAMGVECSDIKTIILTHMHGDHLGGMYHFPEANFLVSRKEYDFAVSKKGPGSGYFKKNWPSSFQPQLIDYKQRKEGVFDESFAFDDHEKIVIVPTPGHSLGHQSVIVKSESTSYFIGGDLTYNLETLRSEVPNVVLPNKEANQSVTKAHEYVKANDCIYLSAHDWNVLRILEERLTYQQFLKSIET